MDRHYLAERLGEGASLEQIGRETGPHASTVAYWAKKCDLSAAGAERFAARGAPDREALERLVGEGATLQSIADELDRSIATVRYWLSKWSIPRPRTRARVDKATAPRIITRRCQRHGPTSFGLEGRGYYRCLLCRQQRVSDWRRRVKRTLIAEAGGKCHMCGYDGVPRHCSSIIANRERNRLPYLATGWHGASRAQGLRRQSVFCYAPTVMQRSKWATRSSVTCN